MSPKRDERSSLALIRRLTITNTVILFMFMAIVVIGGILIVLYVLPYMQDLLGQLPDFSEFGF